MDVIPLEQVIKQYINLPPQTSGTGWLPVLCKVCNDSGRKGARAGFKFDTGGVVGYHCFNCSHKAKYDPAVSRSLSKAMTEILTAFNVPKEEIDKLNLEAFKPRDLVLNTTAKVEVTSIEPMPVPLPCHFYALAEAPTNDVWAKIACDYLEHDRGVDPKSYPFHLAHKTGDPELDRWFGRVIIPVFKNNQLIFYIGRDLTGKKQKKYLSPSYTKEKIIYGFGELFRQTDEPLYIVEGWFDAYAIDGVAILGNEISAPQATWLNKSNRKKVYIPDRLGNGRQTALQALGLGWSIATPGINTWTDEIKDMNDAVKKYGKMFVMKSLAETTAAGFTAEINLGMYCKHEKANKGRSKKKDSSSH